ncbi:MAG: ATP-binding cassette domain-containing protein [Bacteroidales bacterium]|nr:ATP-binding cassette domain-containing protein [Bacteroidales bacterium]
MSEQILKALMELFAIIARPEDNNTDETDRRIVVESYLQRILNQELVDGYLSIFDSFFQRHQKLVNSRGAKRIGPDSVKILRICDQINHELTHKQKLIVLIHLFEFVYSNNAEISNQEFEFIQTVADSFHIEKEEHDLIRDYTIHDIGEIPNSNKLLIVSNSQDFSLPDTKQWYSKYFKGELWLFKSSSANIYFIRYLGDNELYLNGQLLQPYKVYVFNAGSSIRDHNITPIYYSDIVTLFHEEHRESKIVFHAQDIRYQFKNGTVGLHTMSFIKESGRLVGIMGSSGAGKTTLLNILNGSVKPTSGKIEINGIDINENKSNIEGLIGHVSQDDLLIEELTVFQNLYYNAKLCFSNYNEEQIVATVDRMLQNLGLYEIKDIQVGTPLNKMISGGQRKRLNIALELIREPAVLFLDEPTSGLSSRDSENIMDLLKELSLKGKLVFVVIHQPSSDIFKMFDELLILDTGGYLIYDGDPIDSIIYFKSKIHYANYNESECHVCGNVNPEQIFNIVESNILDEYGKFTQRRKYSPKEWSKYYKEHARQQETKVEIPSELPKISFKIPNKIRQFFVFVKRDVLAKLANNQYLIINFVEAPFLAFILSFIIKYYNESESNEFGYTLLGNSNLPVYIFMSVIVAIFMGLTISAEEIIKDRKILKREAFLNLSWSSYLISKIIVLTTLSAIQAALFVLVGNSIMEIKGMYLTYWIVLFSCWVNANIMGLVISDSFKTVVTIYILIPFLVIPQIILSGVIVKYEKLNPTISSPNSIPFYGEIMTARWGYEALAVYQFTENEYIKQFYPLNKMMSTAEFKKYYWVKNLENKIDYISKYYQDKSHRNKINNYLELLYNEIENEHKYSGKYIKFDYLDKLNINDINPKILQATVDHIRRINKFYIKVYNGANDERDKIIRSYQRTPEDKEKFIQIKRDYHNDRLAEFVENSNEPVRIIEYKGRLIQKLDPIYLDPQSNFIKAHFYAPQKKFFGVYYKTFWVNTIVIWLMSLLFYFILYKRGLRKLLDAFDNLSRKYNENPEE